MAEVDCGTEGGQIRERNCKEHKLQKMQKNTSMFSASFLLALSSMFV
jgi:hypothetical protein